ncbi:MAG: sugar ABC transporter ATP-binding protein [Lachnospiraceae bacterium]|nr:sugar ABC transporter ATP-binding protein [Lachnospiraceae bacterium]
MKLLQMEHICKSFDGVPVLKDVSFSVERGEVHALLGENGAGKSTLMNVLTGICPKDSGTVEFEGLNCEHMTIRQSEKMGIAFVHQELNLFNDLKVYENIFLAKEYTDQFGRLNKKRMRKEAKELFERLGVEIDPDAMAGDLRTSQKQLLEIAKALFFHAKLWILDEPTTSLNNEEVAHFFEIIRRLKKEGASFIFISHKMPEIFALSDRYTVFRNGTYVGSGKIAETTPEEVTKMMVGEKYSAEDVYEPREAGDTVLEVKGLSGAGFRDVNLTVRRGQIIGLTGLQGAGSSEFMQGLFGAVRGTEGEIRVFGQNIPENSIHKAMKSKVAMLASNRKENSVLADLSLLENMYLAEHTLSALKFHIHKKEEDRKFTSYRELLNIKMQDSSQPVTSLSGGNQQKVFLARWLNTEAEILLLDNPTQGIDVGAKEEIYKLILELAGKGKTILINTLEIPEIQKVADYCAVFYEGSIVKLLEHKEISEEAVMLYATGSAQ